MIWPLVETLRIIASHLPCSLVSAGALSSIQTLASRLPDATSSYYLESRLTADKPQVDFLACVTVSDGGRAVLARSASNPEQPNLLWKAGDSRWSRVCNLFSQWHDPSSSLYRQVPHLWLEFELAALRASSLPGILFCLDSGHFNSHAKLQTADPITTQQYRQVVDNVLDTLLQPPLSPQNRWMLFSCFMALPPGARILHVSVMLSRQPLTVKLNISIPKDRLLEYLQALTWPGSVSEIETILTTFCSFADKIKLQLTIQKGITPQLDVEFHFGSASPIDPNLYFLLDQTVDYGLCTPEKRTALLTWPGSFRQTYSHHAWPTRLYKWLDIKIIYRANLPLAAKGYLGFMPSSSIF